MQDILQARREARQAMQAARAQEEQLQLQLKRDKRVWYEELQMRAAEARLVSLQSCCSYVCCYIRVVCVCVCVCVCVS